jgi:NADPH-dependent 2,4-dienoyl-CoA reductase/sulfur reductase-like enzyme
VVGKVQLTVPATVVRVTPQGTGLRLELSDGTERDVDHMLFGTGFRPSVDRVPFLSGSIRGQLREQDGFPILDDRFESSVPGLHFVGGLADRSYGPICRFVSGAGPTARRVLAAARSGPPR